MLNPDEKEDAVIEIILQLADIQAREKPELKGKCSIFVEEVVDEIVGISSEDVNKIVRKLGRLKIISLPAFSPDLFICDIKELNRYRAERKSGEVHKIRLVLTRNHLCPKDMPKGKRCYSFRHRKGSPPKRMRIIELMAKNPNRGFSGSDIAKLTGYGSDQTARKELKEIFEAIAKKLNLAATDLYESGGDGYRLKCSIIIDDFPT